MSDNVKMSLHNALTIVGLLVACGVSYASIQGRVKQTEIVNNRQDADIISLGEADHRAELERQENRLMYKDIKAANIRIENWISTIELKARGE